MADDGTMSGKAALWPKARPSHGRLACRFRRDLPCLLRVPSLRGLNFGDVPSRYLALGGFGRLCCQSGTGRSGNAFGHLLPCGIASGFLE